MSTSSPAQSISDTPLIGIDLEIAEKISGRDIIDADGNQELSPNDWFVDEKGLAANKFDVSYFDRQNPAKLNAFLSQGRYEARVITGDDPQTFLVVSLKDKSDLEFHYGHVALVPGLSQISEIVQDRNDPVRKGFNLFVLHQDGLECLNQDIVDDENGDGEKAKKLRLLEAVSESRQNAIEDGEILQQQLERDSLSHDSVGNLWRSLSDYLDRELLFTGRTDRLYGWWTCGLP